LPPAIALLPLTPFQAQKISPATFAMACYFNLCATDSVPLMMHLAHVFI
jgi:hypothetical protein